MTNAEGAERRHEASVTVGNDQDLRRLLAKGLDFGCTPSLIQKDDGGWTVAVIGMRDLLEALQGDGFKVEIRELKPAQSDVGRDDRFEGGKVTPHGFALKVRS
jgi:hypothetical protein